MSEADVRAFNSSYPRDRDQQASCRSTTKPNGEEPASLLKIDNSFSKKSLYSLSLLSSLLSIILSAIITYIITSATLKPASCARYGSAYSPFSEQVNTDLHDVMFHGAVHDNSSIFRQPPSAIVDEAWNRVAASGFEITRTTAEALSLTGKDPSTCVKAPTEWQLGSDAYLVQIDVFHQIHCLNELRKELYPDHYYSEEYRTQVPWSVHIAHKQHCVHILLQNLMCHADLEVRPHHWIHYSTINQSGRPETEPLADFSVHKKCRNFDAILAWAEEVSVKDLAAKWPKLRAPAGSKIFNGKEGYF